jgi:hypothetical protein
MAKQRIEEILEGMNDTLEDWLDMKQDPELAPTAWLVIAAMVALSGFGLLALGLALCAYVEMVKR